MEHLRSLERQATVVTASRNNLATSVVGSMGSLGGLPSLSWVAAMKVLVGSVYLKGSHGGALGRSLCPGTLEGLCDVGVCSEAAGLLHSPHCHHSHYHPLPLHHRHHYDHVTITTIATQCPCREPLTHPWSRLGNSLSPWVLSVPVPVGKCSQLLPCDLGLDWPWHPSVSFVMCHQSRGMAPSWVLSGEWPGPHLRDSAGWVWVPEAHGGPYNGWHSHDGPCCHRSSPQPTFVFWALTSGTAFSLVPIPSQSGQQSPLLGSWGLWAPLELPRAGL